MVRRHKRIGFLRPKQELEKLRPARAMLVAICTEYPIHSDACRRAGEAMKAIDEEPDLDPLAPREVRIDLWPTSNVFLKGHRIRVEISSSDFPRYDRNLNTGEPTATAVAARTAMQTVYHSETYPSHLLLPKIPLIVQRSD